MAEMPIVTTAAPAAPPVVAAPVVKPVDAPAAPPVKPAADVSRSRVFLETTQARLAAETRAKVLEPKAARLDSLMALAKTDPLKFLEETGLSYQDVAAAKAKAMGATPPETVTPKPDPKVEERLNGIEKKQQDEATARELAQKQARETEVATFVADIDTGLRGSEKFPLLNDLGKQPGAIGRLVFDVMTRHHKATGKAITAEEAAPLAEKEIEEQTAKFFEAHPALKARFAAPPVVAEAVEEAPKVAPSGSRNRAFRPFAAPPGVPVAAAKPAPEAKPVPKEAPPTRDAPSGVKKMKGESFAQFMARKEALQGKPSGA